MGVKDKQSKCESGEKRLYYVIQGKFTGFKAVDTKVGRGVPFTEGHEMACRVADACYGNEATIVKCLVRTGKMKQLGHLASVTESQKQAWKSENMNSVRFKYDCELGTMCEVVLRNPQRARKKEVIRSGLKKSHSDTKRPEHSDEKIPEGKTADNKISVIDSDRKKHLKFVMVGETGSGKTSLLNYLCNLPLVQAEFMKSHRGDSKAFDKWEQRSFHKARSEHSGDDISKSSTKDANVYKVQGHDVCITVIDTPGLADTGGVLADDDHLQKVQDAVLKEEYINCMVLVVNGQVPRASAQIAYVMSRLTSILPAAIADKIVVVYTRVEIKEYLQFDPRTITKVIGRPIPSEHELAFDNPFACVELLKRHARMTGIPTSEKALRMLKDKFIQSAKDFQTLLRHMSTFEPLDVKYFKELFDAKANIEEEVVTLDRLLKSIAEKQANLVRAVQDLSNAKDWKERMAGYEKLEEIDEWEKVPNPDGTHNMVCNGCSSTCHHNCKIPMADAPSVFKACECFSSMTSKPVEIKNDHDLQAAKAKMHEKKGNVIDIETQALEKSGADWLEISDNCSLCGVDVMGDPAKHDKRAYDEWIKDSPFSCKAMSNSGWNLSKLKIGAVIPMRDWSNLMRGKAAKCRTCGCAMGLHGHQTFSWKKIKISRAVINDDMKTKYDAFLSEEEQKQSILKELKRQLEEYEKQANKCKQTLQLAVTAFKEKSTAVLYGRVLRSQLEYLDMQKEVAKSDVNMTADVRDAKLKAIDDQKAMLAANLKVVEEMESQVKTRKCLQCKGSGQESFLLFGSTTCRNCNGSGRVGNVAEKDKGRSGRSRPY